jgi:hypothetical protein
MVNQPFEAVKPYFHNLHKFLLVRGLGGKWGKMRIPETPESW